MTHCLSECTSCVAHSTRSGEELVFNLTPELWGKILTRPSTSRLEELIQVQVPQISGSQFFNPAFFEWLPTTILIDKGWTIES